MVARGKFFLYDSIDPALEAGSYKLTADIEIATDENGADPDIGVKALTTHINVTAPRYQLPPDQALLTFPPANSEGSYESRLPQIVLKKRTLPWDRIAAQPGTRIKKQVVQDTTPWLALVVIAEGEGTIEHDVPIDQCVTSGVTLSGKADAPKATCLTVPESIVEKTFPTIEDLSMLTHVREVNIDDTEAAIGDDDGFLAVVIANRMPQFDKVNCKPKSYTACLINLEQQLDVLPGRAPPRLDFSVVDLVIDEKINAVLKGIKTGAAVPLVSSGQPRRLDTSNDEAITNAIRRGEVVFHSGRLTDRAGITSEGLNELGAIDNTSVLEGDFSAITSLSSELKARPAARVNGTFAAFDFPVELIFPEKTYKFPVLTSWRFTCAGAGSFEKLMRGLDVGLLGAVRKGGYKRPQAECVPAAGGTKSDDPPAAKLPLEVAETGHVSVPYMARTGSSGDAWYRSPLSPHRLLRRPLGDGNSAPVLAHVSDHLRMMTPEGRQDLSLAVAFETGRLLAMSQPSFVSSMMRWRAAKFNAAIGRARQKEALADRFKLLDQIVDRRIMDRVLAALERAQLWRLLEGEIFGQLGKNPGRVICGTRPLVDEAIRVPALAGDHRRFLADGLGLNQALLNRVAASPDNPRNVADLRQTSPGRVATASLTPDNQLGGLIDATLEGGIKDLGTLAVGREALATGKVTTVPRFDGMLEFIGSRFKGDR